MKVVAYLVNRYPEASLTTVRREIEAVSNCSIKVLRFAHRPSLQPLAACRDSAEAALTEYLATGNSLGMIRSLIAALILRPAGVCKAFGQIVRLKPLKIRNFSYLLLASRLLERLVAEGADHLHVHFAQSSAVVAMLTRALGGPRWTMTVHGPEDLDLAHQRVLSELAARANGTIAISEWAAASVRKAVAPHVIKIRVIGMGVDRDFLHPPTQIDPAGEILCVARLDRRKGHSVLLEAIRKLRMIGLTPTVRFVGDGPCRTQLESEVLRHGLQSQVQFAGWMLEKQVKECLDACRFFVLPSFSEGLPVSIMEAFARARPVIASEVAGIPELVLTQWNGLLVPPGDADALATAMRTFLEAGAGELFEIGMRGRAEVLSRFQSLQNGQLLVKFWQECH